MPTPKILLVDDDPQSLQSTQKILTFAGYEVTTAQDGQYALDLVRPAAGRSQESFDLIVTDVRMPRLGGLEFLRAISLCGDRTPVILITAFGRVEDAVWAMKLGAVDFLTKPFKRQVLLSAVEAVLRRSKRSSVGTSGAALSGSLESRIIGDSEVIRSLRENISRVAGTVASVLLTGESGTGKELV
ncbi:MAG TPA: hypothetical protein DCS07_12340, partial [Bdellovibrionales bacterium]|nr:hypothetical protein [Bdellovibrionales bacterium]